MSKRGLFILLEGTDGSGKATQAKLLTRAFKRAGRQVKKVDFPQYSKPSAWFVTQYLNGKFGTPKSLGAYKPSLFYALDRFEAADKIRAALQQGRVVIANRYTLSNAAHQGGKLTSPQEQKKYWRWLFDLEYNILRLPQPTTTIILHVPVEISQKLVDKKSARTYIKGKKRDAHEADKNHLRRAEKTYLELVKAYNFTVVECIENGQLLTPKEVHAKVWSIINK